MNRYWTPGRGQAIRTIAVALITGCCGLVVAFQEAHGSVPLETAGRPSLLAAGTPHPTGGLVIGELAADSPLRSILRANGSPGAFHALPGDVLTHVNGEPVSDAASCDLPLRDPSAEARLTIVDRETGKAELWMCRPLIISRQLLLDLSFRPEGGAVVRGIRAGSPTLRLRPAANPDGPRSRIVVGDVIQQIDGQPADSLDQVVTALGQGVGEARLTIADGATGKVSDWLCTPAAVPMPREETTRRIAWVLIVGQTDDKDLGASIRVGIEKLESVFSNWVAGDRLRLRLVEGADCTAEGVAAAVRNLPVGVDDTLLVYYLGHGAFDPGVPESDPTQGHYLDLAGGRLTRETLRREIEARPGRLKILITDACNVEGTVAVPEVPVAMVRILVIEGLSDLERLLFGVRGIVDVESASRGEYSWYGEDVGGWFTYKLASILPRHADWPGFLKQLSADSNAFFKARQLLIVAKPANISPNDYDRLVKQGSMRPKVFRDDLQSDFAEIDELDRTPRQVTDIATEFIPVMAPQN